MRYLLSLCKKRAKNIPGYIIVQFMHASRKRSMSNFTITWVTTQNGGFEHNLPTKVVFTGISILSGITGLAVGKNIFTMLKRKSDRGINDFIKWHTMVNMMLIPVAYGYFTLTQWTKIPGKYITTVGCYATFYSLVFGTVFMNCGTFFISLYRYICVLHNGTLAKYDITNKVN